MAVNGMTVDDMAVDEIAVNEMTVDVLAVDVMTLTMKKWQFMKSLSMKWLLIYRPYITPGTAEKGKFSRPVLSHPLIK